MGLKMEDIWTSFLTWCPAIPAAILCYAPMRNQFRYNRKIVLTVIFLALPMVLLGAAFLETKIGAEFNSFLPALFLVPFFVYHKSLKVPLYKSAAVYLIVFTFMCFAANFALGWDAGKHPTGDINNYSLEATLIQIGVSSLMVGILYYPATRFGSRLVDLFNIGRVWWITLPVSGIFLTYNLLIVPRKYETLHVNKTFLFFWLSLLLLLTLLLLLCVIFYFIVKDMMEAAELEEKNRFLEMQESQYRSQQRYMKETARVRHDFKHTLVTLDELLREGKVETVREYLDDYLASQPKNNTRIFCENIAVNALLNYYMQMAGERKIDMEWEIFFPEKCGISDVDICNVLGNILENAVLACNDVPEDGRFIDLNMRIKNKQELFLVVTNSFNGEVKQVDGSYISNHPGGSGIGLRSIVSTVEKYSGRANFSHKGREFYTDVLMKMEKR